MRETPMMAPEECHKCALYRDFAEKRIKSVHEAYAMEPQNQFTREADERRLGKNAGALMFVALVTSLSLFISSEVAAGASIGRVAALLSLLYFAYVTGYAMGKAT